MIATFLGSEAIKRDGGDFSAATSVGVGALVLVLLVALWVQQPRLYFFDTNGKALLESYGAEDEQTTPLAAVLRELTTTNADSYAFNGAQFDRQHRLLQVASVAVVVETVALLIAL